MTNQIPRVRIANQFDIYIGEKHLEFPFYNLSIFKMETSFLKFNMIEFLVAQHV